MYKRRPNKTYYFSVEGETEQWYLQWLQEIINKFETLTFQVAIKAKVEKNPFKYAKSMPIIQKTEIYHLSDFESNEAIHEKQFIETMDNMKKAMKDKQINYKFGYSNLTFDLWIVLHRSDCNSSLTHRRNYINQLNSNFSEKFINMDEFKKECNFKRCLQKLQITDVIEAVSRAKAINQRNCDNGYTLHEYKGYKYYKENPSLNIWEAIDKILIDCEIEKKDQKTN